MFMLNIPLRGYYSLYPQDLSLFGGEMVEICVKTRLIGYPVVVGFPVRHSNCLSTRPLLHLFQFHISLAD